MAVFVLDTFFTLNEEVSIYAKIFTILLTFLMLVNLGRFRIVSQVIKSICFKMILRLANKQYHI